MTKKLSYLYFAWLLCFLPVFPSTEESSISRYTQSVKQCASTLWNKISKSELNADYVLATYAALIGSHWTYLIFKGQCSENQNTCVNIDDIQHKENQVNNNDPSALDVFVDEDPTITGPSLTEKTLLPQEMARHLPDAVPSSLEKENNSSVSMTVDPKTEDEKREYGCYHITIEDIKNAAYKYVNDTLKTITTRNNSEDPTDPFSDSEQIDTHLSEEDLALIGQKTGETVTHVTSTSKKYAAQFQNWIKDTNFKKELRDFIKSSGKEKQGRWQKQNGHA